MTERSRLRHDAIIVEILYAVLSSALPAALVIGAAALVADALGLHGTTWNGVGMVGAIGVLLVAGVRMTFVLVAARQRGL